MKMASLKASWKITTKHLYAGRGLLPNEMVFEEAKAFEKEFIEYLEHNELELALNALDDMGLLCNAPNEFWHQLELAATNMGLKSEALRFRNIQNT